MEGCSQWQRHSGISHQAAGQHGKNLFERLEGRQIHVPHEGGRRSRQSGRLHRKERHDPVAGYRRAGNQIADGKRNGRPERQRRQHRLRCRLPLACLRRQRYLQICTSVPEAGRRRLAGRSDDHRPERRQAVGQGKYLHGRRSSRRQIRIPVESRRCLRQPERLL